MINSYCIANYIYYSASEPALLNGVFPSGRKDPEVDDGQGYEWDDEGQRDDQGCGDDLVGSRIVSIDVARVANFEERP